MVAQTKIPQQELEVFRFLEDINLVVDVGARTDIDYLTIKPEATYHLFEPDAEFFAELKTLVGDRKNVYLNECGLGDIEGFMGYDETIQAFLGGEARIKNVDKMLSIKTLDSYVLEKGIKAIDFLKIDVEGYDFKVLLGAKSIIPSCRYIQYEHWDDKGEYHDLLGPYFDMEYIGYRNVLCVNKKIVSPQKRLAIKKFLMDGGFEQLV